MLMQIALQNIDKSFGNHIVFQNLSFDFSNCGFYLLCGKSGSGKSTLLNILAGYEDIESGQRIVDAGILGYYMYKNGCEFKDGEGLVLKGVENTIRNIGELSRDGMKETDKEIIKLMCR